MLQTITIPPLPHTLFLMFLCHHQLGNIDKGISTLHDLRILVSDEQQGWRKNYIVLNLLAICLDKIGDVYGAIDACILSIKIKPNRNGASKLLDKLLNTTYGWNPIMH